MYSVGRTNPCGSRCERIDIGCKARPKYINTHTHTTNMHAKLIEKKNKLQNAKNKIDQNQRYLVKQIGKIGDFVGGKCEKLQKLWSVKIDYR